MRDFKGMKRQRGRNRGGGGGGKPQHNANRAFESNGPDNVKVRGAAQTIFERYQQLARDAASAGDRVLAENYLQHAEHYFRTLRAMQPHRPAAEIYGRDQYSSGFDIDFEAEPEEAPAEGAEGGEEGGEGAEARDGGEQPQRRDEGYRRDDRQQRDRYEGRDRQQQGERQQRDERPREDRQQGEGRRDRFDRRDRWRDRDNRDRNREGGEQPRDPLAVVEPQAAPLPAAEPAQASPVLRSGDGDVSHAPAFLGRAAPEPRAEQVADEAPKPARRRRAPKPAPEEA
ncbi:MAG: DUF4167 domain-containing protein [Ignavibacteriales bacterium]